MQEIRTGLWYLLEDYESSHSKASLFISIVFVELDPDRENYVESINSIDVIVSTTAEPKELTWLLVDNNSLVQSILYDLYVLFPSIFRIRATWSSSQFFDKVAM